MSEQRPAEHSSAPPTPFPPPTGRWEAIWGGTAFEAVIVRLLARVAEGRRRMREQPDAGYSTEAVLVTALLVALALAVVAIIAAKITEKANSINLG
ncbi:hypothetical protein [Pseudonocardia sp.]|uniref:hypothetical protein n=1 Tax=Pseudonocardia sp. TaxID=60912 RepID=UPI003D14770D